MNSNRLHASSASPPDGSLYTVKWHVLGATLAIGLLIYVCAFWAAKAELAGAVIGSGTVVVERNLKKVQHLYGGIVAGIDVREGDTVKAGQRLIRLDDTQTRSEFSIVNSQMIELSTRQARLLAERDGAESMTFRSLDSAPFQEELRSRASEQRLFEENRRTRQMQREQLESRVRQLGEEIAALSHQHSARTREININMSEISTVRELHNKQLTSVTRVYALERESSRLSGEQGALSAQIAKARGQIAEIQLQIISIDQTARTEAQRELRTIEARISEVSEKRTALLDRLNRMEIVAPQSGTVHQLSVHSAGAVITPAEAVLHIVPDGEILTVDAKISTAEIDQVHVGKAARLRFVAFNHRTTPEIQARITRISGDAINDPKSIQTYYMVRLEIDETDLPIVRNLRLVPGMPVEVYIATEERTALSYFLKPITDQFGRAFRER